MTASRYPTLHYYYYCTGVARRSKESREAIVTAGKRQSNRVDEEVTAWAEGVGLIRRAQSCCKYLRFHYRQWVESRQ